MEHNVALDIVRVLRPAFELLEIMPARAGAGSVLERALRGRGCILAGGALHRAHEHGVFLVLVGRIGVNALLVDADLQHIRLQRLLCIVREQNLERRLIRNSGLIELVPFLEILNRALRTSAVIAVETAVVVFQRIQPALQANHVAGEGIRINLFQNRRERIGIEIVQQQRIRNSVDLDGQEAFDRRSSGIHRRHLFIVRTHGAFFERAHIRLQVLHRLNGIRAVITVRRALAEAEHAQAGLQRLYRVAL